MHNRFLRALLEIAEVRLVASLRDERLGFAYPKDLRVFIPDLHLISERRRIEGRFKFATNHTGLLTDLLGLIRDLKTQAQPDEIVAPYVIGDFLDLWREEPRLDLAEDAAARIRDDHEDLVDSILDRRLKARFLLGNHDFDLFRWRDYQSWERRYYLADTSLTAPSLIVLHGDVFDWIESFPDSIQQILVYVFAPHLSPNAHDLGDMARLARKAHRNRKYVNYIQAKAPRPLSTIRLAPDSDIPDRCNVRIPGQAPKETLKHLRAAAAEVRRKNQAYGMNLRAAIIGHTHYARIAVQEDAGGGFFALIDCGAWIEDCSWVDESGRRVAAPSAQIAALSNNEIRVYQLAPKV